MYTEKFLCIVFSDFYFFYSLQMDLDGIWNSILRDLPPPYGTLNSSLPIHDYYAEFDFAWPVDLCRVKRAYHTLAGKYHPDKTADPVSHEKVSMGWQIFWLTDFDFHAKFWANMPWANGLSVVGGGGGGDIGFFLPTSGLKAAPLTPPTSGFL